MSKGKVLLIDEAYLLDDNLYGKQALDTIVEKVSGSPGEDIAVVMCGYKSEMMKMFREQNPGLTRRFSPENAFNFDDFDDYQLLEVFTKLCKDEQLRAPFSVRSHAVKLLSKQRRLPNFGNAGAVKTLFNESKKRMVNRLHSQSSKSKPVRELIIEDIDQNYGIAKDPLSQLKGFGTIEEKMLQLGNRIRVRQQEGRPTDGLVGNFVFTGNPGTGKTTVARAMGQLLFDFGLLAKPEVVETSAPDLIGAFVGHSRKAVEDKMKEARGGVLFIDEAYELGNGCSYNQEAITQLLTMLTLPEYVGGKTVVILAGYTDNMHQMLEKNPGLKSRFDQYIEFNDWRSIRCSEFVEERLKEQQFSFDQGSSTLLKEEFEKIIKRPGWANARDAMEMAKKILDHRDSRVAKNSNHSFMENDKLITVNDVKNACDDFIASRPEKKERIDFPFEMMKSQQLQQQLQQQCCDIYSCLARS